uniref:CTLH domain-containing protein n=1 Tax=Steinernema glaseri TaxID=37863 RepID=A0A1I7YPS3_9BILA
MDQSMVSLSPRPPTESDSMEHDDFYDYDEDQPSITSEDFLQECLDPLSDESDHDEMTSALEPSESAQNIIRLITENPGGAVELRSSDDSTPVVAISQKMFDEFLSSGVYNLHKFDDNEPWFERALYLHQQEPDHDVVHDLVLDYLITEGYGEVAEALCEDAGLPFSGKVDTLEQRMEIRNAIEEEGDVDKAMSMVNTLSPSLIESDDETRFLLQQQQIIELVRNEQIDEALAMGEKAMSNTNLLDESILQEMERTFSLLAFDNPESSHFGNLMKISHRQRVANSVNTAVLKSLNKPAISKLEACFKLMIYYSYQLQINTDAPGSAAVAVGTTGSREEYEKTIANKLFQERQSETL